MPHIKALNYIKPTKDNPIRVTTEKTVKITTETLKKEFNKLPTIKYKSKYPNVTMEDVKEKLENLYKQTDKTVDFELLYDFAKDNLGYTREYTRRLVYGERKPYYEKKNDGSVTIFWENIKEDITVEQNKNAWKDIEKNFNLIKERARLFEEIKNNFQRFEWDELEKIYGEEEINERRIQYNKIIESELPEINAQELVDHLRELINPAFEKIKDACLDYFPEVERRFKQNNYIAPLLKLDSYGLPVYDFVHDLSILDNYFPAYRDKIFEELDNDEYDTDVPKGTPTLDDVVESLHYNKFVETNAKRYKIFEENNTVSIGGNPKKEEREQALKRLQQLVEERKQVENEVSNLRSKVDSAQEQVNEETKEEAKEQVQKINQIDYLYDLAESYGISKEMCDPIFITKKSKKEIEEISVKVKEEYYKKKGLPVPQKKDKLFVF